MQLQSLGLSVEQESAYRALLRVPMQSVSDLARHIDRCESQLNDDLGVLCELGLAERQGDLLKAAPPDVAIDSLIERHERRIEQERESLRRSRDVVGELVHEFLTAHVQGGRDAIVEQLDEGRVVRSRLYEMSSSAAIRTRTMVPGGAVPEAAVESALRVDRNLLARGVEVQTIVSEVAVETPYFRAYLEEIERAGAGVRVHPNPPCLLVLVDDAGVVPMGNGSGGAFVLHGGAVISPMVGLFDVVWHESAPLATENPEQTTFSTPRLRQVIELLARGHKDETIARRLGVSTRTVRRMVAEAVTLLGAQSRFQAGVFAAQQGWLASGERPQPRRSAHLAEDGCM